MTYEIYNYIFIGAAIASGILLVVSIVLFFMLDIPKVIGDLTGSNAKKGIEDIRKQNEATGDKSYKSSSVNLKRGRITDKISNSGRVEKPASGAFGVGAGTAKIAGPNPMQPPKAAPAKETMVLDNNNGTMVLNSENATMVLNDENATMLLGDENATSVLGSENATTVLDPGTATMTLESAASEMQTTVLSAPASASAMETTMLTGELASAYPMNQTFVQTAFEVEIEIT